MDFTVLTDLPLVIQFHIGAGLLTLGSGALAFHRSARDRLHRWAGRTFAIALALLCLSSFFILNMPLIGPFSPIHFLSVWMLYGLTRAILAIRSKDIATHAEWMRGLYYGTLFGAGMLTLLPGRTLNRAMFPDWPIMGFALTLVAFGVLYIWMRGQQRSAVAPR